VSFQTRQFLQRLLIRGACDAFFGDDGRDIFCGSHIEGGIFDFDSVGNHLLARNVRDFAFIALLDRDFAAVGGFEIDGRNRRRHIERDAVLFRQDRYGVSSDFIGDVAIGGDAVRAHDDGANFALLHHHSRHIVGDYRRWDPVFH